MTLTASKSKLPGRRLFTSSKSGHFDGPSSTSSSSPLNQKSDYDSDIVWYLFYSTAIIVTCIKLLLIPSYYSTDLEVHRNWMAITYNKPLSEWYTESTSKWTLDYPPFFAYFEYVLARFSVFFDAKMLRIQKEPYMSPATLIYLRLTVILSDLVYYYAVYTWIKLMYQKKRDLYAPVPPIRTRSNFFLSSTAFTHVILFLFNIGHLIVDHIHFQYNGFLNGILLLSVAQICNQQIYRGAFWFAVLLNFKHIYLYVAPAYFIHLFVDYCLERKNGRIKIRFDVLFRLASLVIGVFLVSFLPFILMGQFSVVLKRMFPFVRGLSHAYWAPNFWAMYNGYDLLMARFYRLTNRQSPFTTGLVQQSDHLVVPSITPQFTVACILIILTSIFTSYIWKCINGPKDENSRKKRTLSSKNKNSNRIQSTMKTLEIRFLHLILLSGLTFFEFGYHVHEKSILILLPILIPMIFVKIDYAKQFILLSTSGFYSLFPLLYQEAESILKLLLFTFHLIFTFGTLQNRYRIVDKWNNQQKRRLGDDFNSNEIDNNDDDDDDNESDSDPDFLERRMKKIERWSLSLPLLNWFESVYIYGFIFLHFFYTFMPYILPEIFKRFQFMPLMLISLYCSAGILYCYFNLIKIFAKKF